MLYVPKASIRAQHHNWWSDKIRQSNGLMKSISSYNPPVPCADWGLNSETKEWLQGYKVLLYLVSFVMKSWDSQSIKIQLERNKLRKHFYFDWEKNFSTLFWVRGHKSKQQNKQTLGGSVKRIHAVRNTSDQTRTQTWTWVTAVIK